MTRPLRRVLAGLAVPAGLAAGLAAGAPPALAHDGPGVLVVENDMPMGANGHHYTIRLTWENDGHPAAPDTTLTVTPVAPDGAVQTPVPMTSVDQDGRFEAMVDLVQPGTWTVRFTSISPEANVEVPVEVAAPAEATTESAPATTEPTTETTVASSDDGAQPVETEQSASREDDDGGGSGGALALILAAVALVVVAATVVFVRARMRSVDSPS
jgi:hypothetical protein